MKTSEVLTKGLELISKPENWTTRAFSKTRDGRVCSIDAPDAYCFCSLGALERVGGAWDDVQVLDSFMKGDIATFNDNHTHEEVLAVWGYAIRYAKVWENTQS